MKRIFNEEHKKKFCYCFFFTNYNLFGVADSWASEDEFVIVKLRI
jgi:hypothetical protein